MKNLVEVRMDLLVDQTLIPGHHTEFDLMPSWSLTALCGIFWLLWHCWLAFDSRASLASVFSHLVFVWLKRLHIILQQPFKILMVRSSTPRSSLKFVRRKLAVLQSPQQHDVFILFFSLLDLNFIMLCMSHFVETKLATFRAVFVTWTSSPSTHTQGWSSCTESQ